LGTPCIAEKGLALKPVNLVPALTAGPWIAAIVEAAEITICYQIAVVPRNGV
jgi:hypothetical protein